MGDLSGALVILVAFLALGIGAGGYELFRAIAEWIGIDLDGEQ